MRVVILRCPVFREAGEEEDLTRPLPEERIQGQRGSDQKVGGVGL